MENNKNAETLTGREIKVSSNKKTRTLTIRTDAAKYNNLNKTDIMNIMKKIITLTAVLTFCIICLMAQKNYETAINETCEQSDFSDSAIEATMSKYGFNVDANEIKQPTLTDKIKALFIK